MIFGITEMWVVLIASSAAPLWPLLRKSASSKTNYGSYGSSNGFSASRSGYTMQGSRNGPGDFSNTSHAIALKSQHSRDGSQDEMVSPGVIMMTSGLHIKEESMRNMV